MFINSKIFKRAAIVVLATLTIYVGLVTNCQQLSGKQRVLLLRITD